VLFVLLRFPAPAQPLEGISAIGSTGTTEVPGCALFSLPVDHTVDNASGSYVFNVAASVVNVGFTAGRIRYRLQVSPPPGTATFGDVPTNHPQFQFIEALVASQITVGCGAGNSCPDAGLTRGQMAVFLAKALGLHFPD
jgi:hypothetical protein